MKDYNIPDFINAELWSSFLDMRATVHGSAKKRVNTPHSIHLILKKLIEWQNMGYDANAIIETSVMNEWRGVFRPRGEPPKMPPLLVPRKLKPVIDQFVDDHRIKLQDKSPEQRQEAQAARIKALELVRGGDRS